LRFTSPTETLCKGATKVPTTFTKVNYISAKDLFEVTRLGSFRTESAAAEISARAGISAEQALLF
jgi:hypothetical protein